MLWQENEKNFFFSRNVLPHDQQQRIRLIQTVTMKKAEIHSNTSLGNKYLRYLGEELGKLCPARNTNALAAIVLSLSQDRSVCSGINITAMRQKPCHILTSLVKRVNIAKGTTDPGVDCFDQ